MNNSLRRGYVAALLLVGVFSSYQNIAQAEPNTGSSVKRSPKCQAEYDTCAKNCEKTQIDIDNQIQNCKNKCASDTDMYCSRTLTANPTTKVPTNKLPSTGGTLQRK